MVQLNLMGGKQLVGTPINTHKFQGVSTLNQLEDYGLIRPTSLLTKKNVAQLGLGDRGERLAALRADINRTWDKTRRSRAAVYSKYLEEVECNEAEGGSPAITVFAPSVKATDTALIVPYSGELVAIDGETQLEARYMLRDRLPVTGDHALAITVYHDIPEQAARQILHDYNCYARPLPEGKLGSFSVTGAMSKTIDNALGIAGLNISDINRRGNLPGKKFTASYTQCMHFVAGFTMTDEALGSSAGKFFSALNQAAATAALNHGTADALARVLVSAQDDRIVREAPTVIWQCAGVKMKLAKKGSVNWDRATEAYHHAKQAKLAIKAKIATIYKAI